MQSVSCRVHLLWPSARFQDPEIQFLDQRMLMGVVTLTLFTNICSRFNLLFLLPAVEWVII